MAVCCVNYEFTQNTLVPYSGGKRNMQQTDETGAIIVEEEKIRNNCQIFPNPLTQGSLLQLQCNSETINKVSITNTLGQLIYKGYGANTIDTQLLSPGLYLVSINTSIYKLIIQ